jgi:hypothetical protein
MGSYNTRYEIVSSLSKVAIFRLIPLQLCVMIGRFSHSPTSMCNREVNLRLNSSYMLQVFVTHASFWFKNSWASNK